MQLLTTVIDQAKSYNLTSLINVKAELSITDTNSDTLLNRYITSASAAAAQYCNRVFVVESIQDQFCGVRDTVLFRARHGVLQLSRWPISGITSVVVNSVTLVENTDFITDAINGQLTRLDSSGQRTSWCGLSITVNYNGGFDVIPSDVEDAVIRMVTKRYRAKGRDATLKQESIPGVIERQFWIATGTDAGNMTPDITDILDNYRVPLIA